MTRVWFPPLLAVLVLAGCANGSGHTSSNSPPAPSGVRGVAVVDVGCPTQPTGRRCPVRPVAAHLTLSKAGRSSASPVARADTGGDGRFRLVAPPGRYMLSGTAEGVMGSADPVTVVVRAGRFAAVKVVFDSGVRVPQ